jgi:hypothetical protein
MVRHDLAPDSRRERPPVLETCPHQAWHALHALGVRTLMPRVLPGREREGHTGLIGVPSPAHHPPFGRARIGECSPRGVRAATTSAATRQARWSCSCATPEPQRRLPGKLPLAEDPPIGGCRSNASVPIEIWSVLDPVRATLVGFQRGVMRCASSAARPIRTDMYGGIGRTVPRAPACIPSASPGTGAQLIC